MWRALRARIARRSSRRIQPIGDLQQKRVHLLLQDGLHEMRVASDLGGNLSRYGLNNFFVLAPNLTIYNKLIADFTPNTPKYVLKGIAEFAISPPVITTGDNFERQIASGGNLFPVTINIFNISKINSEVRGGRSPRIRSFKEEIGDSYFDYLAAQKDLVLIMDESHRYRATAGVRAIGERIVKPFVLVIARDTTHAAELMALIKSSAFFEGRYADKVIQVDSSVKEEETIEKLLKVESANEPTEIVIHVNMLKEGWDVTNLYTIVPLRAANARTLIEQSIGRGLRLPYGRRTGVTAVDRLNIVAHDRFQEIVDEARKPDSAIRLQQVILPEGQLEQKTVTVESRPQLEAKLGLQSDAPVSGVSGLE
jgi:restriction endonuclease